MAGRPPKGKCFADMLRIALKQAHGEGGDKLRGVAEALVSKALTGDIPAIKEIADRLDGKVAQTIIGDEDNPLALQITRIELVAPGVKDES